MKTVLGSLTILALAVQSLAAPTLEKRWVVFDVSTEPNNGGTKKSYTMQRWQCHNFKDDGIDKQVSWAYVNVGMSTGCTLFDGANCKGASVNIVKTAHPIGGTSIYNLANFKFDNKASSFSCY